MWAIFVRKKIVPADCYRSSGEPSQVGQTFAQGGNPSAERNTRDKVLTLSFSRCGSILNRFEDFMARQKRRGSSRPGILIRKATPSGWVYSCTVQTSVYLIALLVFSFVVSLQGFAQTPDVDDVHITPRPEPTKS